MSENVLVKAEGVSKKFCKSLKRSLWYGVKDVSHEIFRREKKYEVLRDLEFWAIDDISFEVAQGECLGLIGPNGAGKSTLLKMLNGLVKPDKGRITMRGRVGALIELGAGFNPILTARENIYVNGSVLGFTREEIGQRFEEIVEFAEIGDFVDSPVRNYSSGMKVRLGFAVAAQMRPDILLIDEVLAVGDVKFRARCYDFLAQLKKDTAILFVSHSADQLGRVCDKGLFIRNGKPVIYSAIENALFEYEQSLNSEVSGFLNLNDPCRDFCSELRYEEKKEQSDFSIDFALDTVSAITNARIRVTVFDKMGRPAADCEMPVPDCNSGINEFVMSFGPISLKHGEYSISINIIDSYGNFIVWSHRSMEFTVENRLKSAISSCVLPNPEIELRNG